MRSDTWVVLADAGAAPPRQFQTMIASID
jgi:hypothetical protein